MHDVPTKRERVDRRALLQRAAGVSGAATALMLGGCQQVTRAPSGPALAPSMSR